MSTLRKRINDDIKVVMRQKHKAHLGVLRFVTAALKQKEVDERIELDDAMIIAIIDKMAKQTRDAMQQFAQANRNDLAEKEAFSLEIMQQYLPIALTAKEIEQLVVESISTTDAESAKDMGRVMTILKPQLQGRADMAQVSALVKQKLA